MDGIKVTVSATATTVWMGGASKWWLIVAPMVAYYRPND